MSRVTVLPGAPHLIDWAVPYVVEAKQWRATHNGQALSLLLEDVVTSAMIQALGDLGAGFAAIPLHCRRCRNNTCCYCHKTREGPCLAEPDPDYGF